ncbi:hypothetical protein B0H10DRAFT_2212938 [Mycena sp. CBHHK59/15]|nr:hypothetical protein B0H10DRAFT_2212938 [Mycena sp. CBHHK59/15]
MAHHKSLQDLSERPVVRFRARHQKRVGAAPRNCDELAKYGLGQNSSLGVVKEP